MPSRPISVRDDSGDAWNNTIGRLVEGVAGFAM
jgi:hypothetical protein